MARYIDADKFLSLFDNVSLTEQLPIGSMKILLSTVPSEDVSPVVHAHKVRAHSQGGGTHWVVCSHCEQPIDWQDTYCKHCGAKMDEEAE